MTVCMKRFQVRARVLPLLVAFSAAALPAQIIAGHPAGSKVGLHAEITAKAATIGRLSSSIWSLAETGFAEDQSSVLLQSELRRGGFDVKAGVAGMPSAFVATFRNGAGPVIAITAEFDALPGVTQQADATTPSPIPGKAAGHACGHNLLGAGSVGAALALKDWLIANHFRGEIRVYGSPAEENGDGKAYLVRAGLFDDVDAVIHWHPKDVSAVWTQPTQANIKTAYSFHGIATHAAGSPDKGRSALAGVEVMDSAINAMRQFTRDGTRIHGIITSGGGAPNVVPAFASSLYYVRSYDVSELRSLQARVIRAAQGAAMATETTVDWEIVGGVYPLLINSTLAEIAQASLEQVLPQYRWSAAQEKYAADIQASLNLPRGTHLQPAKLELDVPPGAGSTDVGDISYVVPTVGIFIAAWPGGTTAHSWAATGASGSSIGRDAATIAAEVIAATAIKLYQSPGKLAEARQELERRRGAGFSYISFLGERAPPIPAQKK